MNSVEIREKGEGLEIGHPVRLFTFRPSPGVYRLGLINYDVSPDGKRFLLVVAADENNRPLTLLQNWTNLLPPVTNFARSVASNVLEDSTLTPYKGLSKQQVERFA